MLCGNVFGQTVIPNNNIELGVDFGGNPMLGGPLGLPVSKYIEHGPGSACYFAGCTTAVGFAYDGERIHLPEQFLLDELLDLYLVQPGDVFSLATIRSSEFPTIFQAHPPQVARPFAYVGPSDFYLGVRTGAGFEPSGQPNRSAYGWVHLRPVNGMLTMVSNVMAYNSRGIVVGTSTVVPEPRSVAFLVIGLIVLFLHFTIYRKE
jgi:hypothetical protein